jgi:serine hydrolase
MAESTAMPTVLIVPGLRDHVDEHWQTRLAARLPRVRMVPPMGREDLELAPRIDAIDRELMAIGGPVVIVAHSGGVIALVHWAVAPGRSRKLVRGALLATPPDFETPMPDGYPTLASLDAAGWLPVPVMPLPFPTIVAASRNDPLATFERVSELARCWGSLLVDLGEVGHLNPASGYGEWPRADELIRELSAGNAEQRVAA